MTTRTGPVWRVECRTTLDLAERDSFYGLYERSFGPLRTLAAARHVLTRQEFADEMDAVAVDKYVARAADGTGVGLTTLTRDLRCVPWISPEYYAHHWPEHVATGRLYYLGFTLAEPAHQRSGVFEAMLDVFVERMVAEDAVLTWDMCGYNVETSRLAEAIVGLIDGRSTTDPAVVDTQRYYAADFATRLNGRPRGRLDERPGGVGPR